MNNFSEGHRAFRELVHQSTQLQEQSDYQGAQERAKEALDFAKQVFGDNDPVYSSALIFFAKSLMLLNDYQSAHKNFDEAVKVMQSIEQTEHNLTGEAYLGRAELFFLENDVDSCKRFLNSALEVFNSCDFVEQRVLIKAYELLAKCLVFEAQYEEARSYFIKASNLFDFLASEEFDYDKALLSYELARVEFLRGDFAACRDLLGRILRTLQKLSEVPGDLSGDARILMARVLMEEEQYEDTVKYLLEALNWYRGNYGEYAEKLVEPLCGLGQVYVKLAKVAKAEESFSQAIQIVEKIKGSVHPDLAELHVLQSSIYQGDKQQISKALSCLERALSIFSSTDGSDSLSYLDTFMRYVDFLEKAENFSKLRVVLQRMVSTGRASANIDNKTLAEALFKLANLEAKEGNLDKELLLLNEAVELTEKSDLNTTLKFESQMRLAEACFRQAKMHEARKHFELSLVEIERFYGKSGKEAVHYRNNYTDQLNFFKEIFGAATAAGDVTHLNIPGLNISRKKQGAPREEAFAHLSCSIALLKEIKSLDLARLLLDRLNEALPTGANAEFIEDLRLGLK